MKNFAIAFLLLVFAAPAFSQSALGKSVDDFIGAEMLRQSIPGISLAVVKDGRPLIVKGYGFSNLEHKIPVNPETVFQSGSIGKQFTAAAIMLLVEDGKISLDEKIGKYLGDVPASWSRITVRHLLTHTSGLTDYPSDFDFRRDYTEADLLKIAGQVPLAFAPGERWEYSNLGYMTLGVLIGKVTGKFYGEFLRERIFSPAGMTSARIISESDIIPNRAAGYRVENGQVKNQNWVSPSINTTADGSLYLSALDLIKWDEALTKKSLLKPSSFDLIWSPGVLNSGAKTSYGFGWALKSVNGRRLVEHGGAWQGFRSFISRYPGDRLTVIVLANSANANPQRMAHGVAELVEPALRRKSESDPDPRIRLLFESVLKGNADRAQFSTSLQESIFKRENRLLDHLRKLGPILAFEVVTTQTSESGLTAIYEIQFGSMTVALEVVRGRDGMITTFEIHPE